MPASPLADVVSLEEIAEAAGVPAAEVEALAARGAVCTVEAASRGSVPEAFARLVAFDEAVRVVVALQRGDLRPAAGTAGVALFTPPPAARRSPAMTVALSGGAHAAVAILAVVASLGWTATASERTEPLKIDRPEVRLVFLSMPGPGGGGGGGGLRQPTPPPRAERQGTRRLSSPVPARPLTPPMRPPPRPVEPPPLVARSLPAPVAAVPADTRDREGVVESVPAIEVETAGPGTGGGVGTGEGTGAGAGQGTGIGDGSGGGTGGGPYRPGSGVTPPRLLREVRADYTEQARRAGIAGDVVLEITVRRDGTVGDVRLLQGLGAGLDERAVAAVRQWRFAPSQLHGTNVDVIVEVAVEFRLR
ncbi:MAG: energy transducer TonB [Vicinamibacterales bacterium]|nr:energy transducer TonB [Vicinamibacterales bacterium]